MKDPLPKDNDRFPSPIENLQDIEQIRKLLKYKPRDLLLFELAIQTGLPVTHLLSLKVKDLSLLKPGDPLTVGKDDIHPIHSIRINQDIYQAFERYLEQVKPAQEDHLFKSRKGSKALSIESVSRLVKSWFKKAGLKDLKGVLSLRKTWELHYRVNQPEANKSYVGEQAAKKLHPIHVATRQEAVYLELEKAIISGRISPGERLSAEAVTRQLNVSRIPVREALGRLEARGFISAFAQRGYVVNELSRVSLKEILGLRLMLEGMAVEKAALGCPDERIGRIEALHKQFESARDKRDADELLRTNMEFHLSIYKESNMPILQELIVSLWQKVSPYYHIFFRQAEKPNPWAGIRYHRKIIRALKKRDPQNARRWVEADLTDSAKFVLDLFDIYNGHPNVDIARMP